MARAEDDLGDAVAATQRIESLPAVTARVPDVARERVRAARRVDRNAEATQRLREFLATRPGDGASLSLLAELLADQGEVGKAADALRGALKLSPTDNEVRLRLAELLASNGRAEESDRLFQEAEQLCPDDADVHERRGRPCSTPAGRTRP
jgi:cytochrome c-type biogenesis protein CcmH/NrfG